MPRITNKKISMLPIKFRSVGIRSEKASIAFRIERSNLSLDDADRLICGKRLRMVAKVDPNADDDTKGQKRLANTDIELDSVADVRRLGVSPTTISGTFQFTKDDELAQHLGPFAERAGHVSLECIGNALADEGEDDDAQPRLIAEE